MYFLWKMHCKKMLIFVNQKNNYTYGKNCNQ